MANKLYEESSIRSIANAIRTKNGSTDTYSVSEMSNAILSIPTSSGGSSISGLTKKKYTVTLLLSENDCKNIATYGPSSGDPYEINAEKNKFYIVDYGGLMFTPSLSWFTSNKNMFFFKTAPYEKVRNNTDGYDYWYLTQYFVPQSVGRAIGDGSVVEIICDCVVLWYD